MLCACPSADRCDAPGQCAAGFICDEGRCTDVIPPQPDAALIDSGRSFEDAQVDSGPVSSLDAGALDRGVLGSRDGGRRSDLMSIPQDTGNWAAPGFGASCIVPDFTQGETDPCGIHDPNFFCIARLDGQGGYCTRACVVEAVNDGHHNGFDIGWHPHPHPCDEIGCCVPVEPGVDAGPFMPIDRFCRFGSDCN